MKQFDNDEACRSFLFDMRWSGSFFCPRCDSNRYSYIKTRQLYECLDCRAQISVTAGTVMHGTKLPLSYWIFTFCWVASEEPCTASRLAATLKLNYRSASRMLRAVRLAMKSCNGFHPLSHIKQPKESLQTEPEPIVECATKITLRKAQQFIRFVYRGVSSEYLQYYVDEYYFRRTRPTLFKQAVSNLLNAALRTLPG
ncbi:transposase [Paenibacillus sp. MSJ-34]|nr:transposase [Paenibacillus sp. MSJ-34]CAH0122437.1 hypothetical protein PAE9249_04987 [Paenibacillus sp. CECT 9249]